MCSQKSRLSCCAHTINKSSLHLSSLDLKMPFPYSKFCQYVGESYSCRQKKKKLKVIVIIISSIFRMILTCISVARFRKRIVLSFLTSTLRAAVAPQVEFPTCCACFSLASLSLHKRTLSGKPSSTEAILFVYISIKWGQKG